MAVVGLGGAVATTAVAGLELLRTGRGDATGLPLAGLEVDGRPVEEATGMAGYADLVVGGWDLDGTTRRAAARRRAAASRPCSRSASASARSPRRTRASAPRSPPSP